MFFKNMPLFPLATKDPSLLKEARQQKISVLIPARNEEKSIGAAIDSILANQGVDLEIYVLDDQSEDKTAEIVLVKSIADSRLHLIESKSLEEGWNGKQHACWQLACETDRPWMLFLDADVRLAPDAIERTLGEALRLDVPLLSGFPYQETVGFAEKLLIPMMHFVLLGYLPMAKMRTTTDPRFAAGCGQLFLARRDAYFQWAGIKRSSPHGMMVSNCREHFGRRGFVPTCSMPAIIAYMPHVPYNSTRLMGLMKNADEGIANRVLIVPFTILLSGAAVLPIPSLFYALWRHESILSILLITIATCMTFVPRYLAAVRFRQSGWGVLLHPLSVLWFLQIQWQSFLPKPLG